MHRLSCSMAYGIFLDRGSNPCLLHCQEDSVSLSHQGSPFVFYYEVIEEWKKGRRPPVCTLESGSQKNLHLIPAVSKIGKKVTLLYCLIPLDINWALHSGSNGPPVGMVWVWGHKKKQNVKKEHCLLSSLNIMNIPKQQFPYFKVNLDFLSNLQVRNSQSIFSRPGTSAELERRLINEVGYDGQHISEH